MQKQLITFLVLFTMIDMGCKSIEKCMIGFYRVCSPAEYNTTLQINEDYRFQLNVFDGKTFIGTRGEWKVVDKHLIVNSDTVVRITPSLVLLGTPVSDSLTVYACWYGEREFDGMFSINPIEGANIKLKTSNRWLTLKTNRNGSVKCLNQFIDSIQVFATGMRPVSEAFGRTSTMPIRIGMINEDIEKKKVFLKNEQWKITGWRIKGIINQKEVSFKPGRKYSY
ncbi:hypothetical protein [Xanthocytophaga agilis]|uniref:Uncharacterized protein n=1 Tax=Xanthocytophaga agilis TaxID=3048010 RepID=A0AAE3RDN4_9BACT|nr:hypothetical protein [Xanthocytophaga agilis]MDJ1506047.1 hypothetical protein [Xanthocytophaga agilis]